MNGLTFSHEHTSCGNIDFESAMFLNIRYNGPKVD